MFCGWRAWAKKNQRSASRPAACEATAQPGMAGRELDVHAESRKHALGVVARGMRFGHRRLPVRVEAGQQDRRLHLGGGDRQRVVDAGQPLAAMDAQRRGAVLLRIDLRAH